MYSKLFVIQLLGKYCKHFSDMWLTFFEVHSKQLWGVPLEKVYIEVQCKFQ